MHLPKTPKRGYCFSQEAEIFQKCRKKLLDSIILKRTCDFANDKYVTKIMNGFNFHGIISLIGVVANGIPIYTLLRGIPCVTK